MGYDTVTTMKVHSNRMGKTYAVNRFTEYSIDIDLAMDADQFNVVFANPGGESTGMFEKFDDIDILIDDEPVLHGSIDDVEYIGDDGGNVIHVVGRDMMGILVDNDALPCTKNNIRPDQYIASKCDEYGIRKRVLDSGVSICETLIIGSSESEVSVMNNLIVDDHKRIWTIYDTLYMGEWDTKSAPVYKFTRGVPVEQSGIPIKSIRLRDSGLDVKSEFLIYGSMSNGDEKVVGKATNDYLLSRGIKRRRVMRSSKNDSTTKYSASALKHIRDAFQEGIELKVTVRTDKVILPNRCAVVIDADTKINSVFFIKAVSYNKSIGGGSTTTVTMIPGESTFNVIWDHLGDKKSGSITGTSSMTVSELLQSRK